MVTKKHICFIPQFPQNRYRRKIFSSSGLMRMRLSPLSGDRMVISTMNGFLMVIHDLDLETLEDDLKGFKPNLYRLMQARIKCSTCPIRKCQQNGKC